MDGQDLGTINTHDGVTSDAKNTVDIEGAMETLSKVDLDLAYSSEKLANLDTLLMHLLALENDLEEMAIETENSSEDLSEKVLRSDLLSGILDCEVRELEKFIRTLRPVISDARQKISSCGHLRELFIVMEDKLHDSEESLKKTQEEILEFKIQLAKSERTLLTFKLNDGNYARSVNHLGNGQVKGTNAKPKVQSIEQHRHILRMLEKSLARELDLEKKLSELKQNEEDLKLKLRLTEQVAFCMEEAAEVVWGRFLEAENASEVLMGTSKELVGRLQLIQFHLNGSVQREDYTKSKLQDCIKQLESKEISIQKLENKIEELVKDNSEVCTLREKVQSLEQQLKDSEICLKNANASNEANQEQLREMVHMIESLRENIDIAENRAESAESKVTQLTDTNMELTEEMGFIKNNNDSNTKKMSVFEKQLRELEIQLQHARASSEASQEQQNMLYSAIWDMETLIEELKSKVSKAEIKTENAEEQCVVLTETNFELNKELSFLRVRIECLETSLQQANDAKVESAKDVNVRTKLIMDMVMQLAMERERIQKQLYSLSVENKILVEKLEKAKNDKTPSMHDNKGVNNHMVSSSKHDSDKASEEIATELSSKHFQVDESSKDAPKCEAETVSSVFAKDVTNVVLKLEAERVVEGGKLNQVCVSMAILVLLLSVLATYFFKKKAFLFDVFEG